MRSKNAILHTFITTLLVVIMLTASFADVSTPVLGDGPATITNSSAFSGEDLAISPMETLARAGANLSFVRDHVSGEAGPETIANVSVSSDRAVYDPADNVTVFVLSPESPPSAYVAGPAGDIVRLNLTEYGGGYFSALPGPMAPGNYSVTASVIDPDLNVTAVNSSFVVRGEDAMVTSTADGVDSQSPDAPCAIYDPAKKVVIFKNDSEDASLPANARGLDKVLDQYGIDRNLTNATMTSGLSADGSSLRISLNNKTDGCWYKLSAPIPAGYGVLGVYRDNGTAIPDAESSADDPSGVSPGWYVENDTVYFYDDPSSGYTVLLQSYAYGQAPVAGKTLYLQADYAPYNYNMNTSASPDYSVPIGGLLGGSETWTQNTYFAKDFTLTNSMSVYLYVSAGIGLLSSTTVKLGYYSSDAGTKTIKSWSSSGLLNLQLGGYNQISGTVTLSNNITIKKGGYLWVEVDVGGLLSSETFCQVASLGYYPRVEMYTPSYINVDDARFRDSGNNVITTSTTPATVKAWANVSDPFGAFDIKSVNGTLYYPNCTLFSGPTTMSLTGSGTEWGTYTANFNLTRYMDGGYYNMYVWATETNGVQAYNNTTLYVYGPPSVGINKTVTYVSGNNYLVTLKIRNNRSWEARNVYAYDFYPTGSNGFTTSGFNPSGSYATTAVSWNGGGNAIALGPFTVPANGAITVTYTLTGSGDYKVGNLNIIGIEPW